MINQQVENVHQQSQSQQIANQHVQPQVQQSGTQSATTIAITGTGT